MGCVNGRQFFGGSNAVNKISDIESIVDPADRVYFEISVSYLILYRSHIDKTMSWPLSIVRRYGYEGNTFCFEVGRASTYGQGVYAFKCKDVKLVFDTFKRALQVYNLSTMASNFTFELNNICRPFSIQVYDFDKICDDVSLNSELNNKVQTPYPSLESHSIFLPENIYLNVFYQDEEKNDLQSKKNSDESSEENLIYTEVEIEPCSNPNKKALTPPEKSVYTTIDFIRTMHINKRMLKSRDNSGTRKTRHDYY